MAKQEIQQIINGQLFSTQQNVDSFGKISIQEISTMSQQIVFPYKQVSKFQMLQSKPISNEIVANDSLKQNESLQIINPIAKVTLSESTQQGIDFPYPYTTSKEFTPNFNIDMFEFGDSVDFTYQPVRDAKKEFVQEFDEKVLKINYKQINDTTNNWMFWLLLCTLVIFGWVRLIYRKQLNLTLSSLLHYNFAVKSIRNTSEYSNRFAGILQYIFSINIALFIFQIVNYFYHFNFPGIKSALIVFAITLGVLLMYGIKDVLFKMLGVVFAELNFVQEYLYNVHLYNKALGLFLFPIIISFAFVQSHIINHRIILILGIALILGFFILRIIRGIQISFRSNISISYMFLYFCTLEILPILLLAKTGKIIITVFHL